MGVFLAVIIIGGLILWALTRGVGIQIQKGEKLENNKETFYQLDQRLRKERQDRLTARSKTLKNEIKDTIRKYRYSLNQEKERLVIYDAYGNCDRTEWDKGGVPYFIEKVLRPELGLDWIDWKDITSICSPDPEAGITRLIDQELELIASEASSQAGVFTEMMGGVEYESYCGQILKEHDFNVSITQASGDQGVDLIASKNGKRVCIQCKCYSSPVGNSAVQEVTAGRLHWHGTHAVVVSNAGFTKSAQALARSTGVLLMSHDELADLENRLA